MHVFKIRHQPGCLGGLMRHFKSGLMTNLLKKKPTWHERRFMMGLPCKNRFETPSTSSQPSLEMLQIEEAKETNNQAEIEMAARQLDMIQMQLEKQ